LFIRSFCLLFDRKDCSAMLVKKLMEKVSIKKPQKNVLSFLQKRNWAIPFLRS